jgi:transposase
MGKQHRSHSEEFKRDAVAQIGVGGKGLTYVARALGIHPSLLQTWRRKLAPPEAPQAKSTESIEEENRRLRRENASLREDREILKKASAFFAKELR